MYFFRIFQIEEINQPIITQLKIKANINFSNKVAFYNLSITDIILTRLILLFTHQMQ